MVVDEWPISRVVRSTAAGRAALDAFAAETGPPGKAVADDKPEWAKPFADDVERCFWVEVRRACLTIARAVEVRYNLRDRE